MPSKIIRFVLKKEGGWIMLPANEEASGGNAPEGQQGAGGALGALSQPPQPAGSAAGHDGGGNGNGGSSEQQFAAAPPAPQEDRPVPPAPPRDFYADGVRDGQDPRREPASRLTALKPPRARLNPHAVGVGGTDGARAAPSRDAALRGPGQPRAQPAPPPPQRQWESAEDAGSAGVRRHDRRPANFPGPGADAQQRRSQGGDARKGGEAAHPGCWRWTPPWVRG